MKTKHLSSKFLTLGSLLAGVIVLLVSAQSVSAQSPWLASPSPSPNNNIYYNAGNVGIGTSAPDLAGFGSAANKILSLQGASQRSVVELSNASTGTGGVAGQVTYENGSTQLAATIGVADGATNSGYYALYTNNAGTFSEKMRLDHSGNIGVGTTSPDLFGWAGTVSSAVRVLSMQSVSQRSVLELSNSSTGINGIAGQVTYENGGTQLAATMGVADGATNSGAYALFTNNAGTSSERMRIDHLGNVGIGTTSPDLFGWAGTVSSAVRVLSMRSASQRSVLELSNSSTGTSGIAGQVAFENGGTQLAATIGAADGATNSGAYAIYTNNAGTISERMRIDHLGNVGIGAPPGSGYKLDVYGNTNVAGDLSVTGNIKAKFQDVAEWVPSSEQISEGTVVVLDAAKSNQVISSTVSYDTRVAGVVSAQPGIALGESGSNKVLVATTGRVMVKVDASRGPIHIGDLLVTSDVPGLAMKSEPVNLGGVQLHRPGTLIGKALEPLEKGSGKILVLLSLQ